MDPERIHLVAVVDSRSQADQHLRAPGDAVLVKRGVPRWLVLSCPCACGDTIPVNLDPRSGPAWNLYENRELGLSLFPSIWRDTGCGSHFVVWYDQILGIGGRNRRHDAEILDRVLENLVTGVREKLSDTPTHFRAIADALGAVPWDVQYACQSLVNKGEALALKGEKRGMFIAARK